ADTVPVEDKQLYGLEEQL
ncbi:hypothetical protein TNCT_443131, partial [Trichonephila clavata]